MPHNPSVFLTVLARFRVEQHIVDPMTRLSGAQQVVAIEIPRGVHTEAGITPSKLRVMVGYRVAVLVDDEDVPLAVNTLLGVVVGDGLLQAEGDVEVHGLLHEGLGVGGGV